MLYTTMTLNDLLELIYRHIMYLIRLQIWITYQPNIYIYIYIYTLVKINILKFIWNTFISCWEYYKYIYIFIYLIKTLQMYF